MRIFYDPATELWTLVTPDVVADPKVRVDAVEQPGRRVECVQWRIVPAGYASSP